MWHGLGVLNGPGGVRTQIEGNRPRPPSSFKSTYHLNPSAEDHATTEGMELTGSLAYHNVS